MTVFAQAVVRNNLWPHLSPSSVYTHDLPVRKKVREIVFWPKWSPTKGGWVITVNCRSSINVHKNCTKSQARSHAIFRKLAYLCRLMIGCTPAYHLSSMQWDATTCEPQCFHKSTHHNNTNIRSKLKRQNEGHLSLGTINWAQNRLEKWGPK